MNIADESTSLNALPRLVLNLGVLMLAKISFGNNMKTKQTDGKRRADRAAQQRHRGSKRSYVTEVENLRLLLAWEAGELSEGQVAKHTALPRVDLRDLRLREIQAGLLDCSRSLREAERRIRKIS